jgi:hypothetical protein
MRLITAEHTYFELVILFPREDKIRAIFMTQRISFDSLYAI